MKRFPCVLTTTHTLRYLSHSFAVRLSLCWRITEWSGRKKFIIYSVRHKQQHIQRHVCDKIFIRNVLRNNRSTVPPWFPNLPPPPLRPPPATFLMSPSLPDNKIISHSTKMRRFVLFSSRGSFICLRKRHGVGGVRAEIFKFFLYAWGRWAGWCDGFRSGVGNV